MNNPFADLIKPKTDNEISEDNPFASIVGGPKTSGSIDDKREQIKEEEEKQRQKVAEAERLRQEEAARVEAIRNDPKNMSSDRLKDAMPEPQTLEEKAIYDATIKKRKEEEKQAAIDMGLEEDPKKNSELKSLREKYLPKDVQNRDDPIYITPDGKPWQEPKEEDPNPFSSIPKKWKRGWDTVRLGELNAEVLFGDADPDVVDKVSQEIEANMEEIAYPDFDWLQVMITPNELANTAAATEAIVGETSELFPFMWSATVEGAKFGVVFGALGAMAGAPTGVGILPGAAQGFKHGFGGGVFQKTMKIEGGNLYRELVREGFSPDAAKEVAIPASAVIAGIEILQVGRIMKRIPGVGRIWKKKAAEHLLRNETMLKILKRITWQMTKDVGKNTAEELAQELTQIIGKVIIGTSERFEHELPNLVGKYKTPTVKEALGQMFEVGRKMLLGMPLMFLPGATLQFAVEGGKLKKYQKGVKAARDKKIKAAADQAVKDWRKQQSEKAEAANFDNAKKIIEKAGGRNVAKAYKEQRGNFLIQFDAGENKETVAMRLSDITPKKVKEKIDAKLKEFEEAKKKEAEQKKKEEKPKKKKRKKVEKKPKKKVKRVDPVFSDTITKAVEDLADQLPPPPNEEMSPMNQFLLDMWHEINSGTAGEIIVTRDPETGEVTHAGSRPSTFPDYFKDSGFGKEEALRIIDNVMGGELITQRQYDFLKDMLLGKIDYMNNMKDRLKEKSAPYEQTPAGKQQLIPGTEEESRKKAEFGKKEKELPPQKETATPLQQAANDAKQYKLFEETSAYGDSYVPPFYSHAERVVEEKMPNRAPADQARKILENAMLSQDESEWLDLDEFFRGKKTVTKDELLEYVRANKIAISEVWKGDMPVEQEDLNRIEQLVNQRNEAENALRQAQDLRLEKKAIADSKISKLLSFENSTIDPHLFINERSYSDRHHLMTNRGGQEHIIYQIQVQPDYMAASLEQAPTTELVNEILFKEPILSIVLYDIGNNGITSYNGHYVIKLSDIDTLNLNLNQRDAFNEWISSVREAVWAYLAERQARFSFNTASDLLTYSRRGSGGMPQFYKWTQKGGENYRELLFTSEAGNKKVKEVKKKVNALLKKKYMEEGMTSAEAGARVKSLERYSYANADWDSQAKEKVPDAYAQYRNALDKYSMIPFTRSHWGESNVIAHVRMKDRIQEGTDKKILYIEEIQSDWHQKGKEFGYLNPSRKMYIKELEDRQFRLLSEKDKVIAKLDDFLKKYPHIYRDTIWTMNWDTVPTILDNISLEFQKTREYFSEESSSKLAEKEAEDLEKARIEHEAIEDEYASVAEKEDTIRATLATAKGDAIQDAPLKKGWADYALKRMFRWAAEHGYDGVAWTVGEHQYERYPGMKLENRVGLRKYYDEILVSKAKKIIKKWGATVQMYSKIEPGAYGNLVIFTDKMRQSVLHEGQRVASDVVQYELDLGDQLRTELTQKSEAVNSQTLPHTKGGIRTIALAFREELIQTGRIDLRGKSARTAEEIALLAQIYRDPRYETLRTIYVKDGKIVAHEGVTSRTPDMVNFFPDVKGRDDNTALNMFIQKTKDRIRRTGADKVYLLHNHPSGRSDTSAEDRDITVRARKMFGDIFQGHIVIDDGEYTTISPIRGRTETFSLSHKQDEIENWDLLRDSFYPENVGRNLRGPHDVVTIGGQLQTQEGFITLIYRNAKGLVSAIQEVPQGLITSDQIRGYIKNRMADFGGSGVIAYIPMDMSKASALLGPSLAKLHKDGYLLDVITRRGDSLNEEFGRYKRFDEREGAFPKTWRVNEDGQPEYIYNQETSDDLDELSASMWDVNLTKNPEIKLRVNKTQIYKWIEKQFGVPIRSKMTHIMRKAEGYYFPNRDIIRMKKWGDLEVLTHELAHHIDHEIMRKKYGRNWVRDLALPGKKKAVMAELAGLDYNQKARRIHEGFAEFMRHYLTDTGQHDLKAPNFTELFFKQILPENPKLKAKIEKLKHLYWIWNKQGAQERILSHIDFKGEHSERSMMESIQKGWNDTYEMMVDELFSIKKAMNQLGVESRKNVRPTQDPFEMATYYKQKASGVARAFVEMAAVDEYGNPIGKSLAQILAGVVDTKDLAQIFLPRQMRDFHKTKLGKFISYWVSLRAMHLETRRGIQSGFDIGDVKFIIEANKSPEFDQAARELNQWADQLLDWVVRAGGLSEGAADMFRTMNPIYVPFQRAFLQGSVQAFAGMGGNKMFPRSTGIKKIKGSARPIINPIETLISQATEMISKAHKMRIANLVADLAEKHKAGGLVTPIPLQLTPQVVSSQKALQALIRMGLKIVDAEGNPVDILPPGGGDVGDADIESGMMLDASEVDQFMTLFFHSPYTNKPNTVMVFRKGKPVLYELHPDLYNSLQGVDPIKLEGVMTVLSAFTRLKRLGATGLNPVFGIGRNPFKDFLSATIFSKDWWFHPLSPFIGLFDEVMAKPGSPAWRFKAAGGDLSSMMGYDRAQVMVAYDDALLEKLKGVGKTLKIVRHPIDTLRRLFNIPEMAPRIAELKKSMKRYRKKHPNWTEEDIWVAAFNDAQDITINFTRSGRVGKKANQLMFAFNASIQGINKLYRSMRENPVQTIVKGIVALSIPSIAMWWRVKDEEWYKNLDPAYKLNNLWFEIGDTVYRLPIPYDVGTVFSALAVAIAEVAYRGNDEEMIRALADVAIDQLPIQFPDVVSPTIEVWRNKNYLNRPIESLGMRLSLPSEKRIRDYTPGWAKWLSKGFNDLGIELSPVQVDHLANGYTGGLAKRVGGIGSWKLSEPKETPFVGSFTQKNPDNPSRQLNNFYKEYDELRFRRNSDDDLTRKEEYRYKSLYKMSDIASKARKQIKKYKEAGNEKAIKAVYHNLSRQLKRRGFE